MHSFVRRIIGAARLRAEVYEEVEADERAFTQALVVVILSSAAISIGAAGRVGIAGLLMAACAGFVGWALWSALTYVIGAQWFPMPSTRANWGQLRRTTGFAMSPGLIGVLGVIPALRGLIVYLAFIWILIASVVAVRQALDYPGTGRALAVCVAGWAVYAGLLLALFSVK
jgi:Yip1 domain